jgi:Putative papain-like cysteine peptidase (DUF1796)
MPGPYDEIISLGRACQTAHQLRHQLNLDRAHVFDWLVTSDPGLLTLIENQLDGHFTRDRLQPDAKGKMVDPLTGTAFIHDLPPGVNVDRAYAKAAPRVAALVTRWHQVMASDASVLFHPPARLGA